MRAYALSRRIGLLAVRLNFTIPYPRTRGSARIVYRESPKEIS